MSDKLKIYVASSWRNTIQPAVVSFLRERGHEVYDFKNPPGRTGFSWSSISVDWKNWTHEEYRKALFHPNAKAGFKSDFDSMQYANAFVLVLPCGASAHTEAGWAAGQYKPVIVVNLSTGGFEAELMYKIFDSYCSSWEEFKSEMEILEEGSIEAMNLNCNL
ncbi:MULTISPECIES: hypothetical protein [Nostocales]|jgi:hypothetical protein|uniref:hypothetical protein n=1 Tax=Nostocales TaxID=1161 RepID=UPI00232CDD7E|nr:MULTISPECIES: hypothetical protein [Aphanizomenonaceae]MDB9473477.1 hypothetical protein [Dolichospermum circinale CS-537/11]MDB9500048.1 hypothetical protein [Nodularia spumigena CS-336/02]